MFPHVSQDFLVHFLLHSLTLVLEEGFNRSHGKGRHVCLGAYFTQFLAAQAIMPRFI